MNYYYYYVFIQHFLNMFPRGKWEWQQLVFKAQRRGEEKFILVKILKIRILTSD
jgi:hypothetical protein